MRTRPNTVTTAVNDQTASASVLRARVLLPTLAVIATVVMWASSFVIVRWAAPVLPPLPMALLRLLAGTAVLTILVLIASRGRIRLPSRRGLLLTAAYGVLWFAFYTVVLNWAGHWLDAGTTSLVVNLAPLMVALGAGLFFQERFPPGLFLGMAVSLLGIGLIAAAGGLGQIAVVGILLAFLAAVLYAAGMLLQKAALRHTDPLTATWLACMTGTVSLLPFIGETFSELQTTPTAAIVGAVYMGIGPTALGFWFWGYAMNRFATGKVASASLAVPAVVVVMSALALGEAPPLTAIIGGVICLAGVGIAQLYRPRVRLGANL